jgi:hypothetical protein
MITIQITHQCTTITVKGKQCKRFTDLRMWVQEGKWSYARATCKAHGGHEMPSIFKLNDKRLRGPE